MNEFEFPPDVQRLADEALRLADKAHREREAVQREWRQPEVVPIPNEYESGDRIDLKSIIVEALAEAGMGPKTEGGESAKQLPKKKGRKEATVNERMADMLPKDPEKLGWPAHQWATALNVSDAAVKQTHTWKQVIRKARATWAADRAECDLKRAGRDIGRGR